MTVPPRYRLIETEKDALLAEHSALIKRMAARVAELEALVGKPKKTSANSHLPLSQDGPGGKARRAKPRRKARPSRPGVARLLAPDPDRTERCLTEECPHCHAALSAAGQRCRHRYDHIDLPEVHPVVTRVELFGGRCGQYGRRYRAGPPTTMPLGTPFGPGIRSLLAYLHHSHHVSFERLAQMLEELFGLSISGGAIAKAFHRMGTALDTACSAIKAKLLSASVIASDDTTTRVSGVTHWQWVLHSEDAVLHTIAPSRSRAVAAAVLGEHQPEVWISDRYAGQQELGRAHQVCLAHVLRDVQYAIDCGDGVVASKIRDHLRWAIRIGHRRPSLKGSMLAAYAAKAERGLDALLGVPAAHQQRQRTGNPPVGELPQGHQRLPFRLGAGHPRRLSLRHWNRAPAGPVRLDRHPRSDRRNLRRRLTAYRPPAR